MRCIYPLFLLLTILKSLRTPGCELPHPACNDVFTATVDSTPRKTIIDSALGLTPARSVFAAGYVM